ncbi:MAG TPA: sigma 54-interacting transcriptional regulator [Kofleriaceae bacterium]|nr:sigma 54-interacting transcriptional regulator [Kofleriaceae bacterium]
MAPGVFISTRLLEGDHPRLLIDRAELRVIRGPDRGLRVPLALDSLVLGSAPECQIVLHDSTVSSRHAEIVLTSRGYVIRDLGSKNRILLGSWPIERAPLSDGLRLTLGGTVLAVHHLGGEDEVELGAPRRFGDLVARSVKMRAAVGDLEKLAAADITVLIEGETGTGKELAAHALHAASRRASGPFVVFDCGAHVPTLIAAELFGHERGAFTGADASRRGVFEEAEHGTLFLDEIGELPLELQPILLRVLESRTSRRVGGSAELHHDVRLVAATHRNLAEEVRAGRFRQDLFYRLAAARVRLPPLRERPEDIPVLAGQFAAEVGADLSPELLAVLAAHDWPGNVRELHHAMTRAAIDPDHLVLAASIDRAASDPAAIDPRTSSLEPLPTARRAAGERFERDYLERALALAGGSVSRAAELAGVSRQMLTRLLARHGVRGGGRP